MIGFNSPAGATRLGFLGSSTNGAASGAATITYTDGTTQAFTPGFTDWASSPPAGGNLAVATMPYRNQRNATADGRARRRGGLTAA